jgi:hypothetical protein
MADGQGGGRPLGAGAGVEQVRVLGERVHGDQLTPARGRFSGRRDGKPEFSGVFGKNLARFRYWVGWGTPVRPVAASAVQDRDALDDERRGLLPCVVGAGPVQGAVVNVCAQGGLLDRSGWDFRSVSLPPAVLAGGRKLFWGHGDYCCCQGSLLS